MKYYASWTGTKRNLQALQDNGWAVLTGPNLMSRTAGWKRPVWADGTPAPFVLDNGAWSYHQKGQPFDEAAFLRAVKVADGKEDWLVLPDIVEGGMKSLEFSKKWIHRFPDRNCLLAVQDGMTVADVEPLLPEVYGLFQCGSTDWKIQTMQEWGDLCYKHGAYFHVGRVNSKKRIRMCWKARAKSFDGTSATRFAKNAPIVARYVREVMQEPI